MGGARAREEWSDVRRRGTTELIAIHQLKVELRHRALSCSAMSIQLYLSVGLETEQSVLSWSVDYGI